MSVKNVMQDIDFLLHHHHNPGFKQVLLNRIESACEALKATALDPDVGPWEVSQDGRTLSSDDFDHDVTLHVKGDFYDDAARRAYSLRLAQQLNGLPKEPPSALIESMCLRYAHDFGLDKDPAAPLSAGWNDDERAALRRTMRQLYEEVAGHGFYRP